MHYRNHYVTAYSKEHNHTVNKKGEKSLKK